MPRPTTSALVLLAPGECYRLVGTQGVGRVDVARHALHVPFTLPYVVDGEDLLLGTSAYPKLAMVLDGAVVSIEVDATDLATHTGWRIVLVGPAEAGDDIVRIRPTDVMGYRLPELGRQ